jgi:acetyl-CoA C-acetyltransferase/acetyl-CoA acyltransferase
VLPRLGAWLKFRPADLKPVFGLEVGLRDPVCGANMGETAENLAREFGIPRQEQDAFALESHRRVAAAQDGGFFKGEIFPLYAAPAYAEVAGDIGPRREQTLEALSRLRPYFDRRFGSVTVGNSCPVTDGAAVLALADAGTAARLGIQPLGRIVDYAYAGCPPERMGLGPLYSTARLLDRTGLKLDDFDRIELNEAFAAQVLACERAFDSRSFARAELNRSQALGELRRERLNANGGAIALGHPVGATGARLVLTLLRELQDKKLHRGLAALCVGGGQGGSLICERLAS